MQLAVYDMEHNRDKKTADDPAEKENIPVDEEGTSARNIESIKEALVRYHADLDQRLAESDSTLINDVVRARRRRELYFKKHNPKAYEIYRAERHEHRNLLRQRYPKLLAKIDEIRADEDSKHK